MRQLKTGRHRRRFDLSVVIGILLSVALLLSLPLARAESAIPFRDMQAHVARAKLPPPPWQGPQTGPAAQTDQEIAIIAEDLRNGGILGVTQGFSEAARILDWKLKIFDAGGTRAGRDRAIASALAYRPDGLLLVGVDAEDMRDRLTAFQKRGTPIVGWHVGPRAGALHNQAVAMNVSTDPGEVARMAAMAAIVAGKGHAGIVIFTDSHFRIATAKTQAMLDTLRHCAQCTVLDVLDIPISNSAVEVPSATRELISRHGRNWTHALAINDIYFDYAVPEIIKAGAKARHLQLISAGDGSAAAFMRIQAQTYQSATVAEPLIQHGWQLADELNRLLAGKPVTGYVAPAHLVTEDNYQNDTGLAYAFDPANDYRLTYRRIWQR